MRLNTGASRVADKGMEVEVIQGKLYVSIPVLHDPTPPVKAESYQKFFASSSNQWQPQQDGHQAGNFRCTAYPHNA